MANTTDPRVDAYIAAAAPFAQPILTYLRKCMHDAHPGVAEDIKWRMPFFLLDGKPLANMAAFKAHCAFGFWKGRELMGEADRSGEAMGQFGRITAKAELPDAKAMKALIREAIAAAEARAAAPAASRPRTSKPLPPMPPELAAALKAAPGAQAAFDALPPSHRREHIEAVADAKREETRQRRVAAVVAKLLESAPRKSR